MAAKIDEDHQRRLVSDKAHRQWERERQRAANESQVNEMQRRKKLLENRQKQEDEQVECMYWIICVVMHTDNFCEIIHSLFDGL